MLLFSITGGEGSRATVFLTLLCVTTFGLLVWFGSGLSVHLAIINLMVMLPVFEVLYRSKDTLEFHSVWGRKAVLPIGLKQNLSAIAWNTLALVLFVGPGLSLISPDGFSNESAGEIFRGLGGFFIGFSGLMGLLFLAYSFLRRQLEK
jgi:hypothetical protein